MTDRVEWHLPLGLTHFATLVSFHPPTLSCAECPLVPTADGKAKYICARHGVCDFDPEIRNSRCFCNDGWSGALPFLLFWAPLTCRLESSSQPRSSLA